MFRILALLFLLVSPASAQYIGLSGGSGSGSSSLVVGTTTITGGTTTRILYDNAGVLGEYTLTGTGTVVVMQASPTFTGTVVIPTPFTLGATSVTSTGTQLNYLNAATGTTGTTSTNVVFSTSPSLTTPALGVATATSVAINGATIGTNSLAVTGTANISSTLTLGVGSAGTPSINVSDANTGFFRSGSSQVALSLGGSTAIFYENASIGQIFTSGFGLGWSSSTTIATRDASLSRNAAGVLQFGTTALNASGAWLAAKGTLTGGTLADQAQVLAITATQPASPTGTQIAISNTVTSAGSAAQASIAFYTSYASGYTGSSRTFSGAFDNNVAGTGSTLIPAAGSSNVVGNVGVSGAAFAATNGLNIGQVGFATSGNISVGLAGFAQLAKNAATNIGVVGSAINTGTTPVQIGGFFSLNQTTIPTVSAAIIADNGSQSDSIALFRAAGSTVGSFNATGGITTTLTNAATTSAVCYAVGTNGLLTYNSTVGTCTVSVLAAKNLVAPLSPIDGYNTVMGMKPYRYELKEGLPTYTPGEQIGFIADWVKDDRLVARNSDGSVSGMRYEQYTAALTAAFHYMADQIKELKADNDNLRSTLVRRAANGG